MDGFFKEDLLEYLATAEDEAKASHLMNFVMRSFLIVIAPMSGGGGIARTHFQRVSHSVCKAAF